MTSPIFKVETVEHLNFLGHGLIANSLLYCGIETGLFDALGKGPKSTQQLEKELNINTRAVRALLSPLAALGLVERDEDLWKNSEVADKYLVQGKASYMGTYFAKTLYEGQNRRLGNLLDVLKSGVPYEQVMVYGEEWRSRAKVVIPGQHEGSLATANYLMKKKILDLSKNKAFLDLGCGSGAYAIAACQTYPKLKACCVDFEEVLEVTKEFIETSGLAQRITTQSLSYLHDPLPEGYDMIWFGGTLNGYSAKQIQTIMAKVYDVLPDGGQLSLYDYFLFNDRTGPIFAALMNVGSFIGSSEAHYLTLGEMEQILDEVGFRNVRHEPLINEMTWLFWADK